MAKREENLTWRDRVQGWWETDTAKAVATIIAVLLIPASVIAWNYATNKSDDVRNQLEIGGTSTTNDDTDQPTDNDSDDNSTNINEEETNSMPGQNTQGQEPANTNNGEEKPAVGGLGSVQTLPNTDSSEEYTVLKGDNVYRISMKVCGNDSYYELNMKRDYLKVGQTIKVTCN